VIKFTDIQDAFSFVSSAAYGFHTAIVSKDTGRVYWRSDQGELDELSDQDLPSERCVEIAHRNELGLGQELVVEFVEEHLADDSDAVQEMFHHRGAYGRFKQLLQSKGLLQSWYDFEQEREEEALRQWCDESGFEISG
jgi:hypothetical protein